MWQIDRAKRKPVKRFETFAVQVFWLEKRSVLVEEVSLGVVPVSSLIKLIASAPLRPLFSSSSVAPFGCLLPFQLATLVS